MAGTVGLFDLAAQLVPLLSLPLLLLAILAWGRIAGLRRLVASVGFLRIALVAGAATFLLYLGQVVVYLGYPAYVDHVQTSIAAMSYMVVHGQDLYPSPDGSAVYGVPYGPILFLANGLGLRLAPSILGSKLPGIAALLCTAVAVWRVVVRKLGDRTDAFLSLATVLALLLPYGLFAYWNRPESFLLLCAALALAALGLPRIRAELAVGALLGLAVGLKLHGFVFVAPAALALVGRSVTWRKRAESLLLQAAAAVPVVLAPFALSNVSLANYRHYVSMAAGHGLDFQMLWTSFALGAAIVGPPALLYAWRRPSLAAVDRWLLFGLLAAMAVAVLIAGRVQAGAYHILPMVPVGVYATAVVANPALAGRPLPLVQRNFRAASLMLALLAGGTGFLRNYGGLSVMEAIQNRAAAGEAVAELGELAGQYPMAQMAVSDDDRYWLSMQEAALVMRSGRIAIDYASWMDLVFVGADSSRLMQFLDHCRVPAWIMPKDGAPFTLTSLYTRAPLFTEEFRRRFLENYVEAKTGRFYRVWTCRAG